MVHIALGFVLGSVIIAAAVLLPIVRYRRSEGEAMIKTGWDRELDRDMFGPG